MSKFTLIPVDTLTRNLLVEILAKMFRHDASSLNKESQLMKNYNVVMIQSKNLTQDEIQNRLTEIFNLILEFNSEKKDATNPAAKQDTVTSPQ